eukprot:TRINITY_DN8637_c0_g1_i1.p1 TRINITY_DN8637_c0_g1~~TRINITY_DN8637_c0_g1_i1.p1  ORF type:complete len:493 (+),score=134.67 TRINITY_DN8637_c0_g1_i1:158-1636(+)
MNGNILLATTGSRGDVQPFICLAEELLLRNYLVVFCTHGEFREFVEAELSADHPNFRFVPLKGSPTKIMTSDTFKRAFFQGTRLDQLKEHGKVVDLNDAANPEIIYSAVKDLKVDAIITNIVSQMECLAIGQKEMIPVYFACTIPFTPCNELPCVTITSKTFPLGIMNKLTYSVSHAAQWAVFGKRINKFRQEVLQIPPQKGLEFQQLPMYCCWSELICPRPVDYPENVKLTGYWTLKLKSHVKLDEKVTKFLDAGSPPVYMGFGSMGVPDVKSLTVTFSEVLKKLGLRGIFCGGWSDVGSQDNEETDHLLVVKAAPHELLLPRCLMAIHHGGSGTTAASLRSGLPNICFTVISDQPFWADKIAALGVGPLKHYPVQQMNAATLEEQITFCMREDVRKNAKELSTKLLAEDGILNTVNHFEESFKTRPQKRTIEWENASSCGSCKKSFGWLQNTKSNCRKCGAARCSSCVVSCAVMNYMGPQDVCKGCEVKV